MDESFHPFEIASIAIYDWFCRSYGGGENFQSGNFRDQYNQVPARAVRKK